MLTGRGNGWTKPKPLQESSRKDRDQARKRQWRPGSSGKHTHAEMVVMAHDLKYPARLKKMDEI